MGLGRSIGRGIGKFFGGHMKNKNPADEAMNHFNKIPGVANAAYDPYIQGGMEAQAINNPIYKGMAATPGEWYRNIERQYNPSEGYRFKQQQGMDAMKNTAAAGGFAGTPYDQGEQAKFMNGLLSEDMQQFLGNYLGIQNQGLAGNEQRIERGYGASGHKADMLASNLSQMAGAAFQGQQQINQHKMDRNKHMQEFVLGLAQAAGGAYGAKKGAPDSNTGTPGSSINTLDRSSQPDFGGYQQNNSRYFSRSRSPAFGSYNDYMRR